MTASAIRPWKTAPIRRSGSSAWAGLAEEEARRIEAALGDVGVRVEHVGSTAVPGLVAKPIIDLLLIVAMVEPPAPYRDPFEGVGYLFVPDPDCPDSHFFAKPAQRPRSHHLHACATGSEHEVRHLALRDYLRAHLGEAAGYAAVKREVAARSRNPSPTSTPRAPTSTRLSDAR